LGELEDDDLVNFVIQLLRDKSTPEAVVEGVEPVSARRKCLTLLLLALKVNQISLTGAR
jgi:hypothetical protein